MAVPSGKRMDALSREILVLTGGVTPPSLVPFRSLDGHAGASHDGGGDGSGAGAGKRARPKVRWIRKRFTNGARKDGMLFEHWGKVGETHDEYPFAKFNKRVQMVTYSNEEYEEHLLGVQPPPSRTAVDSGSGEGAGSDSNSWTREETDMLLNFCEEFDLRFVVIHDRWPVDEVTGKTKRSIEELKDRYYSLAKKLIEVRPRTRPTQPATGALQKHCQAIVANPFDVEYEVERKRQLETQYRRSKAELREEEETVREARRIEANRKRILKEKQRMKKLLAPAGDIRVVGNRIAPSSSADADEGAHQNRSGGFSTTQAGPHGPKSEYYFVDPSQGNHPNRMTFPHRKVQVGSFARSNLIYTPVSQSARVAKRIEGVLEELGVGLRPLATSHVVDHFDLLRLEIASYLELQRTVMRKEEEVHSLRVKLAKLKGEPAPQPPPGVTLSHKKRKTDDLLADAGAVSAAVTAEERRKRKR